MTSPYVIGTSFSSVSDITAVAHCCWKLNNVQLDHILFNYIYSSYLTKSSVLMFASILLFNSWFVSNLRWVGDIKRLAPLRRLNSNRFELEFQISISYPFCPIAFCRSGHLCWNLQNYNLIASTKLNYLVEIGPEFVCLLAEFAPERPVIGVLDGVLLQVPNRVEQFATVLESG